MTDSADKLAYLDKLRGSFVDYGRECLRIRAKDESTIPFVMNVAQKFAHELIEAQKAAKGWVRAMILKGRQQGISTYVAARFYHRAATRRGVNVYILAHEQPASDTLFGIVDRYQRNNPLAPHVGASNAKELVFDKRDSSYAVATAGTKAGGRSKAISLFHGSEVAYWANAQEHFSSAVQGVPLVAGTEILLESTSAGSGGEFYERWQDAESKRGDYIPIFLPWWLSEEYQREPEAGFALTSDAEEGEMCEEEYADIYKLSASRMMWRRGKIIELRSPIAFQREYPAYAAEAWTPPVGFEPFISALYVMRARRRARDGHGPLILGVDPASNGGDRFAMAARRGLSVDFVKYRNHIDTLEGTEWIKHAIDTLKPARVNVDIGNIGAAIVTNLKAAGPHYAEIVRGVNFGGTSQAKLAQPKKAGPANRRAEMWARMRDWLMLLEGVSLPDDPELGPMIQTDITSPRLKPRLNNDFLLESKQQMKERKVRSPDLADAIALTFAFNEWLTNYDSPAPLTSFGNPENVPLPANIGGPLIGGATGWMC